MEDIIKKFKFKNAAIVINAPITIEKEFVKLGFKNELDKKLKNTDVVVFINDQKEFLNFLNNDLKLLEEDCVLWFAYPKGTSKVKTDINRDTLCITGEEFGITTVSAISINDIWSALRFRPIHKVGK